jgi:hypothetical protein
MIEARGLKGRFEFPRREARALETRQDWTGVDATVGDDPGVRALQHCRIEALEGRRRQALAAFDPMSLSSEIEDRHDLHPRALDAETGQKISKAPVEARRPVPDRDLGRGHDRQKAASVEPLDRLHRLRPGALAAYAIVRLGIQSSRLTRISRE